MKEYFDWHRVQMEALKKNGVTNYEERRDNNGDEIKFLLLCCSEKELKCGGLADRIKSLPFFVALAARTKRIFMIYWDRPTKLEEFLIPNEVDWSVPNWFYEREKPLNVFGARSIYRAATAKKKATERALEGLAMDFYGGSREYYRMDAEMDGNKTFNKTLAKELNDYLGWPEYQAVSRDIFDALFRPSPPVEKLVREQMESFGLIPGQYSASQYRAFYAVEHKKHTVSEETLKFKTRNAINCATMVHPGAPIYFASDSVVAVRHARKYGRKLNHTIVTTDETKEALHLDKRAQWTSGNVSDFYSTFVDLLIMKEARCMSTGEGGFGRFANILSADTSCYVRHDTKTARKTASLCGWYNGVDGVAYTGDDVVPPAVGW